MNRRKILKSMLLFGASYPALKFMNLNANSLDGQNINLLTGICNEISYKIKYLNELNKFEEYVGHKHDIFHFFSMFDYRSTPYDMVVPLFYTIPLNLWNSGRIPLLSWYPSTGAIEKTPVDMCKRIYTGLFDKYLARCCKSIKEYLNVAKPSPIYGSPKIFIRFAHEMNIHYRLYSNPEEFIKMWRYVYNFLRNYGLNKEQVLFVFSPNCVDINTQPFENYYPGDDYTEWLGLDGYNWGGHGPWKSFFEIFDEPMSRMNAISNKPLGICEFGTSAKIKNTFNASKKSLWLEDSFKWLSNKENLKRYNLRMAVYFNFSKQKDIDSGIYLHSARATVNNDALNHSDNEFKTIKSLNEIYYKENIGFLNARQNATLVFS
jgi:hypothetical protein